MVTDLSFQVSSNILSIISSRVATFYQLFRRGSRVTVDLSTTSQNVVVAKSFRNS